MRQEELLECLKTACDEYHSILLHKDLGGMSVTNVTSITEETARGQFTLMLSDPIKSQFRDASLIAIDGKVYSAIAIKQASNKPPSIRVQVPERNIEGFQRINPNRVKVVADLKYLIEKLKRYYERSLLQTPQLQTLPSPLPQKWAEAMTQEQHDAYEGVFTSSTCYVWGAPGTGKTSMVLSRCILRYVLDNRRVLLLAPTNNAIEQVLRSVIPVMEAAGVDPFFIYRFGTSSDEFAREFPQAIGNEHLENKQMELAEQITEIKEQIDKAHRDLQRFSERERLLEQNYQALCDAAAPVLAGIEEYITIGKQMRHIVEKVSGCIDKKKKSDDAVVLAQTKLEQSRQSRDNPEDSLLKINFQINSWCFFFFSRSKKERLQLEQATLSTKFSSLLKELSANEKQLSECIQDTAEAADNLKFALKEEKDIIRAHKQERERLLLQISKSPHLRFHFKDCKSLERFPTIIQAAIDQAKQDIETHQGKRPSIDVLALEAHYNDLCAELQAIGETSILSKKRRALVLAGTFDSALAILPVPSDEAPISHAFIDEAGYTSFARGMVPFTLGCPVAMFGDHMQLPPVCEATSKELREKQSACLFALSVIQYEAVRSKSAEYLQQVNAYHATPEFSEDFPVFSLNLSFRFGDALAQLLGEYFYSHNFHGLSDRDFSIEVIHAPAMSDGQDRTNRNEASAILEYLRAHKIEDCAILAPYNNQVNLLRAMCSRIVDRENILTVHRAQGQEWDTIIFSPTDEPTGFLVNSSILQGQQVLATAISRAKKKLVLVCDRNAWARNKQQFLGQIAAKQ